MTATATLPTIDLAELIQVASLQTRIDRKYALHSADAEMALDLVDPRTTQVLRIDGVSNLGYSSTYLDTPGLATFHLAARGRRRRFKVRTRTYESDGATFLEVKTRHRDRTVKHRLPGQHLEQGLLSGQGSAFVDRILGEAGTRGVSAGELTSSMRVDYRRVTLFHPSTATRVTVDSDLAWWDVRTGRFLSRPNLAIIETKTAGRPGEVDQLLWSLGHRPDTVSKYATALAAMHPELPANKWRRVLRRHF